MNQAEGIIHAIRLKFLSEDELLWISNGSELIMNSLKEGELRFLENTDACFYKIYFILSNVRKGHLPEVPASSADDFLHFLCKPAAEYRLPEYLQECGTALWQALQYKRLKNISDDINSKVSLTGKGEDAIYHAEIESPHRESLYNNQSDKLGIDFGVTRIAFNTEVLDPRIVTIAPGKTNELHKHAHETVFVFFKGSGFVKIDDLKFPVKPGDIVFIPRWCMHQSVNESNEEMVFLAVADFGLTGTSFIGNYLKTARLKS
jgi:mannose-6-phosphate isomerase-like protein (cupin superfamily)